MTSTAVQIERERPEDFGAIRDLLRAAFAGDAEAELVELLRARGKATIALVARADGQVVGHILFSRMTVERAPDGFRAIGLAPLAVLPEYQRQGVGAALMAAGVSACRQAGYDAIAVLGHPAYYPRFGFARASSYGLSNVYGADDAFMVLELRPGALREIGGTLRYAPEFAELGV